MRYVEDVSSKGSYVISDKRGTTSCQSHDGGGEDGRNGTAEFMTDKSEMEIELLDDMAASLLDDEDDEDEEEEIYLVDSDNTKSEEEKDEGSQKSGFCPPWCNITAEPVLVLYSMSWGIRGPQTQALIYDKLCRASYNETVCASLGLHGLYDVEEDIIQTAASRWYLIYQFFFEIPAIFFTFYYGALGDSISRRLSLLIPLLGALVYVGNVLIQSIFIYSHVAWFILGCLVEGFAGGWLTCLMAVNSIVSEANPEKKRTIRLSIMEGANAAGMGITFVAGGVIYDHTNYYVVFSLSFALIVLAVIYLAVFVKEPERPSTNEVKMSALAAVSQIKATFSVIVRKRPNRGRIRLNILLIAIYLSMMSHYALPTLQFLYVKRRPLSWGQTEFTLFQSLTRVLQAVVQIIILPLIAAYCPVSDTMLLFAGIISGAVSELFFSFSTKTWMVFLVPILGIMSDVRFIALRSLVSKIVQLNELGRVFSFVGALQSLTGMTGTAIYNNIYPHTLSFWPGLCFAVGASVAIIPLALTWWVHRQMAKIHNYQELGTKDVDQIPEEKIPMTQVAANDEDLSDDEEEKHEEEKQEEDTEGQEEPKQNQEDEGQNED